MGKGLISYGKTALGDPGGQITSLKPMVLMLLTAFQMLSNVVLLSVYSMCSCYLIFKKPTENVFPFHRKCN